MKSIYLFALAATLIINTTLISSAYSSCPKLNVVGTYNTVIRGHEKVRLKLTQSGAKVNGIYHNGRSVIKGVLFGDTLRGQYYYNNDINPTGPVKLKFSIKGTKLNFSGNWHNTKSRSKGTWKGKMSSSSITCPKLNISGTYNTLIRGRENVRLKITQSGNRITGVYHKGKSIIKGKLVGDTLRGKFYYNNDVTPTGPVRLKFKLRDNQLQFSGNWKDNKRGRKGTWTGKEGKK